MTGNWFWVFNNAENWDSRNQNECPSSIENAAYVRLIRTANEKLPSAAWCSEATNLVSSVPSTVPACPIKWAGV
jgi:hypothetical protein